ncbi:MFS transporter [Pseudonocardia hierapolitana]|uniref:MFS transporter n=1 Tax=Pseudonocardia hierapolitana TaxID=1128676 RepID=A0A561T283_9PSEU|nr:MFS transporter [Pseudonocardia hierapolitana]TWF81211.1 MFS transporter [Pseudonocardia hierapolitana]
MTQAVPAVDTDIVPRSPGGWSVVAAAAFGASVTVMQQSAVLPLLPRLQTELGADVTAVSWTFTISMLVGAVATPLFSRFGDMYGRRRMLLVSFVLLLAGSVLAGLATSLPTLLLGRVVQGFSVAVIPLSIGVVRGALPPERMATGIGTISATIGIGSGIGLVLSGVIAQYTTGFRAVFWVMAVLAAAALVIGAIVLRDPTPPQGGRPDIPGAILLAGGLVTLLLGITEGRSWGWTSAGIVGLFAASVVLFAIWVAVERRTAEPLVDIDLLTHRGTIGASVASMLLGFAMFGGFSLAPQFVQAPATAGYGFGASVLEAGLYLLPASLLMMIVSPASGGLIRRLSAPYVVAIGAVLTGASELWLVLSHAHVTDVLISMTLLGVGIGLAYSALATMAIEHVEPARTGVASGVNSLVRMLGASVSGAVAAAVLAAHVAPGAALPSAAGYELGFGITAIGAGLAAAFAVGFGWRGRRPVPQL